MRSQDIYPQKRRDEVYKNYSPELDLAIDAIEAIEAENELLELKIEMLIMQIEEIHATKLSTFSKN